MAHLPNVASTCKTNLLKEFLFHPILFQIRFLLPIAFSLQLKEVSCRTASSHDKEARLHYPKLLDYMPNIASSYRQGRFSTSLLYFLFGLFRFLRNFSTAFHTPLPSLQTRIPNSAAQTYPYQVSLVYIHQEQVP